MEHKTVFEYRKDIRILKSKFKRLREHHSDLIDAIQ